jgi:2-dehydropantoate 2-reductase
MKILIIGAGAIGGLYAGKLSQAGAEVSVICRSDYEKVKRDGIRVESIWGDFKFIPKNVYANSSEVKEKFDFVIVTTKVLPEISLKELISPALDSNSSIALIQNGIFIEKEVAKIFPNSHLASIIAFVATEKTAAGLIKHTDNGKLTFGEYSHANPSKTKALIDLFSSSKVPCFLAEDIQLERWKKLLWNASFNPISVLAGGLDTKEMLDNPQITDLIKNVMCEVALLAKTQGYEISEELIDKTIQDTKNRAIPARSSMLIDFEAKKPLEFEAILGNALRFAKEKHVTTPYISTLYALISDS